LKTLKKHFYNKSAIDWFNFEFRAKKIKSSLYMSRKNILREKKKVLQNIIFKSRLRNRETTKEIS
jgi:hypothetical protein